MTYAIMVRMRGNDIGSEVELCRVASNPEAIAEAARAKVLMVDGGGLRKVAVPLYEWVEVKKIP